jgi:hypothetical protein
MTAEQPQIFAKPVTSSGRMMTPARDQSCERGTAASSMAVAISPDDIEPVDCYFADPLGRPKLVSRAQDSQYCGRKDDLEHLLSIANISPIRSGREPCSI